MARRGHYRILSFGLGAALLLAVSSAHAQQGADPAAGRVNANGPATPRTGADNKAAVDGRAQSAYASLERLSPAEREAFQRNVWLWRDLTPEQREVVRLQTEQRRIKRKTEAERTLNESGLQLDADRREVFILRYLQERRKLERELRQKMDAERTRRLPEIAAQLKKEFSEPPDPPQNRGPQVPFMR